MYKQVFICDACGKEEELNKSYGHPDKWIEIEKNWFCQKHEIMVKKDNGESIIFNKRKDKNNNKISRVK